MSELRPCFWYLRRRTLSQPRKSTWPMTTLRCAGWSTAVKIAATHDAAPDNSQSAPQTPADWQHPACCSRWPPALRQHRASGYWQSPLAREHRCNVQTTLSANRAQQSIDPGDSRHERLGRLNGLRVGHWHLQSHRWAQAWVSSETRGQVLNSYFFSAES